MRLMLESVASQRKILPFKHTESIDGWLESIFRDGEERKSVMCLLKESHTTTIDLWICRPPTTAQNLSKDILPSPSLPAFVTVLSALWCKCVSFRLFSSSSWAPGRVPHWKDSHIGPCRRYGKETSTSAFYCLWHWTESPPQWILSSLLVHSHLCTMYLLLAVLKNSCNSSRDRNSSTLKDPNGPNQAS